MIFGLIDDLMRAAETARDEAYEALFEPTLRIGVTGLSRAGKTVFITSLITHLLDRGRLLGLRAHAEERIDAVMLRPHPERDVPRFDYERHAADLAGPDPRWPESTRAVAQLRLSIRHRSGGMFSALTGPSALHVDIVDYPGEWLLDLPLLDTRYEAWSEAALKAAEAPFRAQHADAWRTALAQADLDAAHDEPTAQRLSAAYAAYLARCRAAGLPGSSPGRFLMPGDLEGSPMLSFAPLPPGPSKRGSLREEFRRRYEAYREKIVKPFFRDHFARIDRQVVLVDMLGALDAGPGAVADLRTSMTDILAAFRPGANSWLSAILGKRVDRILLAATKADHVHQAQHGRMSTLVEALLKESVARAEFRGAKTRALALATLRATVEQTISRDGRDLPCVRGTLLETGKEGAFFPGDLPEDPRAVLAQAREDSPRDGGWLGGDLRAMAFAPPRISGRPGEGPPHIRLDEALEFLLGDRLQ